MFVDQFPAKFAALVHPRATDEDRDRILDQFFASEEQPIPECCMDGDFSAKVRARFATKAELLGDRTFMKALHVWAKSSRLTNMHLERMLAAMKRHISSVAKGSSVTAERLVSVSQLGQVLGYHLEAGGRDPRTTTRAQLKKEGAPIKAARVWTSASRPPSGYLLFLAEQRCLKRAHLGLEKLTKAQNDQVCWVCKFLQLKQAHKVEARSGFASQSCRQPLVSSTREGFACFVLCPGGSREQRSLVGAHPGRALAMGSSRADSVGKETVRRN